MSFVDISSLRRAGASVLNRAAASVVGQATNAISNSISNIGSVSPSSTLLPPGIAPGAKILSFPADVGDGSSNNHFVTFQIKEFKPAKVSAARRLLREAQANLANLTTGDALNDEDSVAAIGDFIEGGEQVVAAARANLAKAEGGLGFGQAGFGRGVTGTSIALRESQKSQIIKTIALFMPPSVNTSYSVSYADTEVGFLADAGIQAIDAFFASQAAGNTTLANVQSGFDAAATTLRDATTAVSLKALDTIAPGARSIFQATQGTVIAPKFELTFERVARRNFSYTFIMIPKSEAEAQTVQQIVTAFKMAMHPEFVNSTRSFRRMKMPDLIDITYHSHGNENNFIHKISTCYLKSVNVTYGGDRYTAHEPTVGEFGRGSPPQRTSITLEFSELGILSKEDIEVGF